MATTKATIPTTAAKRSRRDERHVWLIEAGKEAGRWGWDVRLTREDGTVYRKAGSKATEREARAARDKARADYNAHHSGAVAVESKTLDSWLDHCEASLWPKRVDDSTRRGYEWRLRLYIRPRLGKARLSALTTMTIQRALDDIATDATPNVARACRVALSSALTLAVRQGAVERNACSGTETVKVRKARGEQLVADKRILASEEQTALLDAARGTVLYLPILLGLRAALRVGECCGLQWRDVDLDARKIHVRRQLIESPERWGGTRLGDTKTDAGRRTVPMSQSLWEALTEAQRTATTDYVCTGPDGGRLLPMRVISTIGALARRTVIGTHTDGSPLYLNDPRHNKPDLTHHDCRSTLLSYLANEADGGRGVPPAVLATLAGHSDYSTTMAYYIRTSSDTAELAMSHVA